MIPVLCGFGYWVMQHSGGRFCPFTAHWNRTEEKIHRGDFSDFFARGGIVHRPTDFNE